MLALLLYDPVAAVAAKDLTDAEVRQLKEVAAAVAPTADRTPVTTDLDAYASTRKWKILGQAIAHGYESVAEWHPF